MNWLYLLLIIPGVLTWLAQARVRRIYEEYGEQQNSRGVTGGEVTRRLLAEEGIEDVEITRAEGHLTDHYDPKERVVRLSDGVANTASVTAMGIAAHEVGHIVQEAEGHRFTRLRAWLARWLEKGARVSSLIFVGAMVFHIPFLQIASGAFLALFTLFTLVALPVELHASKTAIDLLDATGLANEHDKRGVKRVLRSAALTYVTGLGRQLANFCFFVAVVGAARG